MTTRNRLLGSNALTARPADPLRDILGTDLQWVSDSAVCAQTDGSLFFPETGEPNTTAKQLCQSCPLIEACLAYALTHDVQGVWAATTQAERYRLRRKQNLPPVRRPAVIVHGTEGGYRQHYRLKVPLCDSCRDAQRLAKAAREAQKKGEAA